MVATNLILMRVIKTIPLSHSTTVWRMTTEAGYHTRESGVGVMGSMGGRKHSREQVGAASRASHRWCL